jgi:hypothetical protein
MEFDVTLTTEHLQRIGSTQPLTGLIELIWNALDADATEIAVRFGRNELDGIDDIRVVDNGHGMLASEVRSRFGAIGASRKAAEIASPGGRPMHGREGRGRYRAASIGSRIIWRTVATDPERSGKNFHTTVELEVSNLIRVSVSEPEVTADPTGTTVLIPGLGGSAPRGLGGSTPVDRLTATFGLQLQNFNAHLTYDGVEIDPTAAQDHRVDVPLPAEPEDALLTIIEWNRKIERGLYLCDSKGTPLAEQSPGIQAPGFDFTAYLQWTGFDGKGESELQFIHLDGSGGLELLEAAKDELRDHFKRRAAERTREQIERWKAENSYPFKGDATNATEQAVRDTFDVVAIAASPAVSGTDLRSRRLSLALIREALEQDPGSLNRVMREVLDLPEDRLVELSALLDHTSLGSMIALSREVANRLNFLQGLELLVLSPDIKPFVKERSQLHKILAAETWVFGEEYALSVNDESLTRVLEQHIALLRPEENSPVEAVKDLEGHVGIVDLMLSRSLAQTRNRREHLVVELKRPSVKIGDDQAAQIRKYATAVAGNPRFETVEAEWDFYVVSGEITGSPALERKDSPDRPYGQIMNAGGVRVWVKTWAEILDDAKHRLKFAQQQLEYEPGAGQGLAYLKQTHAKYLPAQAPPTSSGTADLADDADD